jgi:hypothetical protein
MTSAGMTLTMIAFKRYKSDWYVTIGIVLVLFAIYGTMIWQFRVRFKEEALINELKSLRVAVVTFNYIHQRNPTDMEELVESFFKTKEGDERPLVSPYLKRKGLTDPFGNVYKYDPESGWVETTTEDYKGW